MSRYIATAAIRGAKHIVAEADAMLQSALKELGPETPIAIGMIGGEGHGA